MSDAARNLMLEAMDACTLLIGDCWPVFEVLKSDPEYFEREAARRQEMRA